MTATLIDLPGPGQRRDDLPGLQAVLVPQLVGEPFLFGRMAYADELILHFGTAREYTVPRFGKRTEGSHTLSVRGSAWLVKSGTRPEVAEAGLLPATLAELFGKPVAKEDLEAGALVEKDSRVVAAVPFPFKPVSGYGLQLLLSDGSRLTILPTPLAADQPGDEELPELADWELLSPHGVLKVGPGPKWSYSLLPDGDDSKGRDAPTEGHNRITRALSPQATTTLRGDTKEMLEDILVPVYIHLAPPTGFGFPTLRVFEVCESPTEKTPIRWKDMNATIYAKSSIDHVDLVCVSEDEQPRQVLFAFRAFPDLSATPLTRLTPLEVVERFAERFGLTIFVGGQSGKLFLEREFPPSRVLIPGAPPGEIIHTDNPKGVPFLQVFCFKAIPSGVRIVMAFCVNMADYGEWARRH